MGANDGRRELRAGFLGRLAYGEALRLQLVLRDAILRREGPDCLLLLEHPHVFTLGRNADRADVRASAEWLRAQGVEVVETDRGGQVTYHGPGQLVGYPVIDLSPDRRDLRRYVRDLQQVLVDTLADYGVEATGGSGEHIGVWVGGEAGVGGGARKIASIGVHLRRWVTTHGFALNVATDLGFFGGIVACGMPDVRMTSLEGELGRAVPLEEVASRCAGHFAARFERRLTPADPSWLDNVAVGDAARRSAGDAEQQLGRTR